MTRLNAVPTYSDLLAITSRGRCPVQSQRATAANKQPDPALYGPVDAEAAEDFLRRYHEDCPEAGPVEPRLQQVRATIASVGTYLHTRGELVYGARIAWRNSSRCIGRLYWRSLRVFDRRSAGTPEEIHDCLVTHLRKTTNRGQIRPAISIFAPALPGRPYSRIWNEQLIRYAGYAGPDGQVIGDRRYVRFTELVQELGWVSKGTAFDILPLVVDVPGTAPQLFELPEDAVLEVPLRHPEHPWFAELDLRWHAVPAISNMRLEIGGVHYPFAPFNGWYMGTEIGARNLADADRYDLVPEVARRLGLDTSSDATLWRDRTLIELNVAVLHSFAAAGVKISDHHTESRRFLIHLEREERAGRIVPADWSWIVPPISGGATGVFHRYYDEADLRPNFFLDDHARRLAVNDHATVAPVSRCPEESVAPAQRPPAPSTPPKAQKPTSAWEHPLKRLSCIGGWRWR